MATVRYTKWLPCKLHGITLTNDLSGITSMLSALNVRYTVKTRLGRYNKRRVVQIAVFADVAGLTREGIQIPGATRTAAR